MGRPQNVDVLGSLQRRLPINPPLYIGPRGRPTQLQRMDAMRPSVCVL